jgi:hypothetical protein
MAIFFSECKVSFLFGRRLRNGIDKPQRNGFHKLRGMTKQSQCVTASAGRLSATFQRKGLFECWPAIVIELSEA